MTGHRRTTLVVALLIVSCLGGAVAMEVARDRQFGEPAPGDTVLYMRAPETVKRLSLAYSSVLADLYWIRTLQYYGGMRLATGTQQDFRELHTLLDITTTLDPHFRIAYQFGAIFLAEPRPGGAGRPDLAVELLQKGFRAEPKFWRYLQDIGFVYYWWVGDFKQAAAWFRKAADVPGAAWWLRPLVAVTLSEGGDRQSSRMLWQSLLSTADNDWLRKSARLRLAQLDALDQIDQLNQSLDTYARRTGERATSWTALVRAGILRREPIDPSGSPYILEPGTGHATVAPDSRLYPLPSGARTRLGGQ